MTKQARNFIIAMASILLLVGGGVLANHIPPIFNIKVAEWNEWRQELRVAGICGYRCNIMIYNAGNMVQIGEAFCSNKRWFVKIPEEYLDPIPCRVYAEQLESDTCEYEDDSMDVQNAPDDCGP